MNLRTLVCLLWLGLLVFAYPLESKGFEADLVPAEGSTATLTEGYVSVEEEGEVELEIEGSNLANTLLSVWYEANGSLSLIGTVCTDKEGDAEGEFELPGVGTKIYVTEYQNQDVKYYVTGQAGPDGEDCEGDSDCDGCNDMEDPYPKRANMFDAYKSHHELQSAYVAKMNSINAKVQAELKALQAKIKAVNETRKLSLKNVKDDYNERKHDSDLDADHQ